MTGIDASTTSTKACDFGQLNLLGAYLSGSDRAAFWIADRMALRTA